MFLRLPKIYPYFKMGPIFTDPSFVSSKIGLILSDHLLLCFKFRLIFLDPLPVYCKVALKFADPSLVRLKHGLLNPDTLPVCFPIGLSFLNFADALLRLFL